MTHSDHSASMEICTYIKWLEALSNIPGNKVSNVDTKALGRVARKLRELHEALDALVTYAEDEARGCEVYETQEQFELTWQSSDPKGYEVWTTGKRVLGLCSQHSSEELPSA